MKQVLLESNNEEDLKLLIHLADRLNVRHSDYLPVSNLSDEHYTHLHQSILDYPGQQTSSFDDASEWQRQTREDRPLPWQGQ